MPSYLFILFGSFVAYCLFLLISSYLRSRKYKFPNPVPGIPIFGNSFQIPPTQQGPWGKALAEKYGEMFTCKFGGNTWVFLNSSRVVYDLMERRAAIYSSRPRWPMTQGVMSGESRIVLMPYSERWRVLRKIMHNILSKRQQDVFRPFQDLESKHLLYDYLKEPEQWHVANGRYANSVIMSVIFGKRSDLGSPQTRELYETVDDFLANQQPGVNIVDAFPQLEKLPKPLQWWRPRGERIFQKTRNVYKRELDELRSKMAAGAARQCFAVDFLKQQKESESTLSETQQLFVLGSLMEAGSDTSRSSINQIIAAAVTYPDWPARARVQLDCICGANAERLPGWDDYDDLPYITAVVKEGFRWRPNIAEIGVPTMLTRDDEYEGYRFPAGTVFVWNAWAISLSDKEYQQAERFWPERFLNNDMDNVLKGQWGFGMGRRVCVGWNVGTMNVWIAIARLLYCFDFEEVPNEPIDTMRIPQLTKNKPPFAVKIKLRSENHAALIERDCIDAVNAKY